MGLTEHKYMKLEAVVNSGNILEVHHLSRTYTSGGRALTVLDDVSFHLARRETCAIVACRTLVQDVEDNALTLSVRTTNWTLTHLGTAWDRYRISYKVDARLLDGARNKVLASAEYVYSEKYDDTNKAPLLEDLLRDDAALLKSKFHEVEPLAVAELKEEIEEDLRHNGLLGNS